MALDLRVPGPCRELLDTTDQIQPVLCGEPGDGARVFCPAGRPDAEGGPYCEQHGGLGRALDEARSDWHWLAPASVGDEAAVHSAGHARLQTVDRYIVLRQLNEAQGGTWLAWLGLGSMMDPVPNPLREPSRRGGQRHKRRHDRALGFDTREHAETRARSLWRARLDEHVRRITEARGGTLAWGVPIEPADEPIVLVLEQGDTRSAWDIAVTLPRRSREGLAVISGLRPSGEVA